MKINLIRSIVINFMRSIVINFIRSFTNISIIVINMNIYYRNVMNTNISMSITMVITNRTIYGSRMSSNSIDIGSCTDLEYVIETWLYR
jgi:hypothetical protein